MVFVICFFELLYLFWSTNFLVNTVSYNPLYFDWKLGTGNVYWHYSFNCIRPSLYFNAVHFYVDLKLSLCVWFGFIHFTSVTRFQHNIGYIYDRSQMWHRQTDPGSQRPSLPLSKNYNRGRRALTSGTCQGRHCKPICVFKTHSE